LKPVGYEVVNLGSDRPAVLMDTIKTIEQMLEEKANIEFQPAHPADVLATWANISKAKNLLEWQPQTTLNQGIQNLVDWYQANESWAKDIKT
jgi:UDP-glucuronate 4-epimerase